MKKLCLVLVVLLGSVLPAAAQFTPTYVQFPGRLSGDVTLDALNDAVTVETTGYPSVGGILEAGTFDGVLTVESSSDGGVTWDAGQGSGVGGPLTGGQFFTITLTNPNAKITISSIYSGPGMTHVRLRVSTYNSGSLVARLRAANNLDLVGMNLTGMVSGVLAPSRRTVIAGVDGSGLTRSPLVTNSAPSGSDYGFAVWPQGTQTVSATNLDIQSGGADLATTTQAGAIQTAVELIDDTIFTDDTSTHSTGTTKVQGMGLVAAPTDAAVNANDIGMPAMTVNREMYSSLFFAGTIAASNNGASNAQTLRVTMANDSTGILAGVTTVTNLTNLPNEGQQTAANSISVTPDTDNDAIGATAAAVPGEAMYIAGTDGTNVTGFYVDPCQREAKTYYVVDIVTATTTEIANQVASEFFYVCSVDLHTNAANNVAIVEDDTDACASPTAGLNGGVTAAEGYNFAANGGRTLGNGLGTVMKTATANRYFCIITSAATQLSGVITYVSAP